MDSETSTSTLLWLSYSPENASSDVPDSLNYTQTSTPDPEHNTTSSKNERSYLISYDILIPTIAVIIIVTNLSVVISSGLILKKRPTPRTTYMFLGNVALADLLTGITVLFGEVFPKHLRGPVTCYMQIGMIVSTTVTSIWSVGLISIDRFLYILYGMHYQRWLTPRLARWLIMSTWLLGMIIGFLPAMGWREENSNGKICWFIRLAPPEFIVIVTIVGFLPVVVASVLYSIILHNALKKVRQLQNADKNTGHALTNMGTGLAMRVNRGTNATANEHSDKKKSSPKKWKAIKVVLFTNGSFIITWAPYFIACCMYVSCRANSSDVKSCKHLVFAIGIPLIILGTFNSLLNPIIYAWWHNGFRTFVRDVLCKKCRRQTRTIDLNKKTKTSSTSGSSATSSTKTTRASSNKSTQLKETMPVLNEHT